MGYTSKYTGSKIELKLDNCPSGYTDGLDIDDYGYVSVRYGSGLDVDMLNKLVTVIPYNDESQSGTVRYIKPDCYCDLGVINLRTTIRSDLYVLNGIPIYSFKYFVGPRGSIDIVAFEFDFDILWLNGTPPPNNPLTTYEISIIAGLGVWAEFYEEQ